MGKSRRLGLAGKVLAGALALGGVVQRAGGVEIIPFTIPFTNARQLSDGPEWKIHPPDTRYLYNEDDYTISGDSPLFKSSIAFFNQNGIFVGYAEACDEWRTWLEGGRYNVNPSGGDPYNLNPGEKPSGMWVFYDVNGNGRFGEFIEDANYPGQDLYELYIEDNELINNPNFMRINGVFGDFSGLPAYEVGGPSGLQLPPIDVVYFPESSWGDGADTDRDGDVDRDDLACLRDAWGSSYGKGNYDPRADINRDLTINFQDYLLLKAGLGTVVGPSKDVPEPATLGLLALGGGAILGSGLIRKRRH